MGEGEVVAMGPDVPPGSLKVGNRYLVFGWIGCGTEPKPCSCCKIGKENLCTQGSPQRFIDGRTLYGGYSSHVVVPHPRYLIDGAKAYPKLPDGLGCIYMCSGLTAFSALKKIGMPTNGGSDVVIVGLGGLGLQAVQFAKALFGSAPRGVDVSPQARAAAEAMGCKTYDPSKKGQIAQVIQDSGGEGAFAAIDFVGSSRTYFFANNCVRRGGTVVVVGLYGGELQESLIFLPMRGLSIKGSMVGSLDEAHEMLDVIQSGQIQPIPHTFRNISEVNESMDDLRNGRFQGRCVLRWDDEAKL